MKNKIIILSISIAIGILLLIQVMACKTNGNTLPASEETNGVSDESTIVSMMKMTPFNLRSFVFANVKAIREDSELSTYLIEEEGPSGYLDSYGINLNDMNQSGIASYTKGLWLIPPLQIIIGNFDMESIQNLLGMERYTKHEFAGEEIWDVQIEEYMDSVAFQDDVILIGYGEVVRDALDIKQGNEPSLYDNMDFRDVVSRLPPGISVALQEGVFLGQQMYEGLLVTGLSAGKIAENTMELTWVIKFKDIETALDTVDDISSQVENMKIPRFTNVAVVHENQFVIVTAQTGIEDYFGSGTQTNESNG